MIPTQHQTEPHYTYTTQTEPRDNYTTLNRASRYLHYTKQNLMIPTQHQTEPHDTYTTSNIASWYQHNTKQNLVLPTQHQTEPHDTYTTSNRASWYQHNTKQNLVVPTQHQTKPHDTYTAPNRASWYLHNTKHNHVITALHQTTRRSTHQQVYLGRTSAHIQTLHVYLLTVLNWLRKREDQLWSTGMNGRMCGWSTFWHCNKPWCGTECPSPRRLGFDPRLLLVGSVVETVAMEQGFYRIAFDLPVFTNSPFSLTRTYVITCFIHSFIHHSFIHLFISFIHFIHSFHSFISFIHHRHQG